MDFWNSTHGRLANYPKHLSRPPFAKEGGGGLLLLVSAPPLTPGVASKKCYDKKRTQTVERSKRWMGKGQMNLMDWDSMKTRF
ncbi:hypothetical protein JTE90_028665 [Oedothorax gibbosus]|uniref:Uncharacterized protein n=1 Tax=Oedothorax gibbosus TaxID=931172 RepID=A0AAV6UXT7_9ARAC|nr:hypothetical protein JTE90_028665 [Oedothorax gibbosus]